MAIPGREVRQRRLRDQYGKLPEKQKENLGYGTVTKIAPPPKTRREASDPDMTQIEITREAEKIPEGNVNRGGIERLKSVFKRKR